MLKGNIRYVIFLCVTILACQNNKQKNEISNTENEISNKTEHVVGGWAAAEIDDEVKDAAKFAVKELNLSSDIEKITSVKTQIVSGKNYDITFILKNGEKWNVIVYKNIQHAYTLSDSKKASK